MAVATKRKLGLMISVAPEHPNFAHAVRLADAALSRGVEVYLYCIDEATLGLAGRELQGLRDRGARLFGCAYGARRRQLALGGDVIFGGLTILADIMTGTDRFVAFN